MASTKIHPKQREKWVGIYQRCQYGQCYYKDWLYELSRNTVATSKAYFNISRIRPVSSIWVYYDTVFSEPLSNQRYPTYRGDCVVSEFHVNMLLTNNYIIVANLPIYYVTVSLNLKGSIQLQNKDWLLSKVVDCWKCRS